MEVNKITQTQKLNLNLDECKAIFRRLDELTLKKVRHSNNSFNEQSWEKFKHLSLNDQAHTLFHLNNYLNFLTQHTAQIEEIPDLPIEKEVDLTQKALDFFGLSAEFDIQNSFNTGDVIEIYNANMIQIYRNLQFFKTCSYSLLDISTNEWYVLWERPQFVYEAILKQVQEIVENPNFSKLQRYKTTQHVLKEKAFGCNQKLLCEMKYIAPLRDKKTGGLGGFYSVVKTRHTFNDTDSQKIDFI